MIYTVTFNPAIDYIVRMDKPLDPGMTNRSASEDCFFGGKGINVSTVLKNLGIENTALGFAAGFTGEAIVRGVQLARQGQAKLQQAEQRVQILLSDNEDASLTPFTPDNE